MKFFKKSLVKSLFLIFLAVFVFILPVVSFAQTSPSQPTAGTTPSQPTAGTTPSNPCVGKICNPINVSTINEFIRAILTGVLRIGIPIIALAIIYSGFLFVSARGNSEKLTTAKNALLYTLIGAAILLGSWAIAELVHETITGLGT